MEKRLFVENLPSDMGETELAALFSNHGTVVSAEVMVDSESGESRGFGFVEMHNEDQAKAARDALQEHEIGDDKLQVSVDEPRPQAVVAPPKPAETW